VGSEPRRLESPLATDRFVPQTRALLCRKKWSELIYGWWTTLRAASSDAYWSQTVTARRQARKNLDGENDALLAKLRQMSGQHP